MYNLSYYELMLRLNSKTAEEINKIRWDFIAGLEPKTILDYGSGVGWFRAFRPQGVDVYTYDIGSYPQTGDQLEEYDIVCFWDVLEHIPNFDVLWEIMKKTNYIAMTIPIIPDRKDFVLERWKHFKPGEHLHYFTESTLDSFFKAYGFIPYKKGNPECPPREDILSVIYKKSYTETGAKPRGYSYVYEGSSGLEGVLSEVED